MQLSMLIREARNCRLCEADLPEGPRPLLQGSVASRLLIIGQAPGAVAHATGIPWDDRSGKRLRDWLGLGDEQFYDEQSVALMPMGFCYPGKGKSGDMPPRPECAPHWHQRLLSGLRNVQLTVFVGQFAFKQYIKPTYDSLTQAVAAHEELLPTRVVLPHPSPRNNIWLKKNSWFERDTIPALQQRIAECMRASS